MALVSTSIPNLLNGVSQQPAPLRQVTQGETQTNALSSVIDGLIKRPPTEHIAKLFNTNLSTAAIHVIDRGVNNRDIIVVQASPSSATVTVYNLNGTLLTQSPGSTNTILTDYLKCSDPATQIKFLTVNDYTLILNTTKQVASSTAVTGNLLSTQFNDFSELPDGVDNDNATVNNIYEIIGASSESGSYYVKALSTKTYEESAKPGERYQLDATTLPLKLYPDVSNTYDYILDNITWPHRTVGDLESAPFPSFVGSTINNLFFYKNRLGFLSGENVSFSAAGDYFRFFPETVRTVLDDGPIDVSTVHTKTSILKQAIAFNDSLTLFSEHTQFIIENIGALTPKTISIIPSTEFENDANVTPVGAGNNLYFTSNKGDFSSIREYFIEADTVITDAMEITAHVPKYVPKNIVKLTTSSNEDILVALSAQDRSKLYVYKWFNDGQSKLQSSWSTWQLPSNAQVKDVTVLDSNLYLLINYTNGLYLEKIALQYLDDSTLGFCARLDRKFLLQSGASYDGNTDTTTWPLPYHHSGEMKALITNITSSVGSPGRDVVVTRPTNTEIAVSGDYRSVPLIVGIPYDMTYKFSPQYVRERDGSQSIQSGRLQLRTMRVNFENTGFFKIEVTPKGRATNSYEYTGVVLNQLGSTIGDVNLTDGTFRFPIQSKNDRVDIEIKSDSYLPCSFQSAEWEGFYNIRSKRI